MITHTPTFETLAVAPVKQTDTIVAKQISDPYGNYDDYLWTSSDLLMSVKIDALGHFLGSATKKATVKLIGIITTPAPGDLFQIRTGLKNVSTFTYISQGFYIVDKVEFNYEEGYTLVTMYDHMWTAKNRPYSEATQAGTFTFPATVQDLAGYMASAIDADLMVGFSGLPNSNHSIPVDPYINIANATVQNVIEEIAGATGTTARITDTTLTFVPFTVDDEELNSDNLKKLSIGKEYGPVNSVVFGRVPQNDNIVLSSVVPLTSTVTNVNTTTNKLTVPANGMPIGNLVRVESTGTLPAPLDASTNYYIYSGGDPNTFSLAYSYNDAVTSKNAVEFDGSGDYISTPQANSSTLTIELMVRTDTSGRNVFSNMSTLIRIGTTTVTWFPNVNSSAVTLNAGTSLVDGQYHHIVVTQTGTTARLYVDGTLLDSNLSAPAISTGVRNGYLGNYDGAANFDGAISRFRLYTTELTGPEVSELYNETSIPQSGSLFMQYLMTNGSGTTVSDSSGNARHGTITNATWVGLSQFVDITSAGSGTISLQHLPTQEVQINNNQIVDNNRTELLPAVFNTIVGAGWTEVEAETVGLGWHEVGDIIHFNQGSRTVQSFITEIHLVLEGSVKESLKSEIPNVNAINQQTAGGILKTIYNTEIKVDKQNNDITSVVSQQNILGDQITENFTQVYQDLDNILLTVQKSGGGNLIRNSVGYATEQLLDTSTVPYDHLNFWDYNASYNVATNGSVVSYSSSESQNNGGVSGQVLELAGSNLTLTQRVTLAAGQPLSFGFRVNKAVSAGAATVTVSNDHDSFQISINNLTAYNWQELKIEDFATTLPWVDIKITLSSVTKIMMTDLRLVYGTRLTGWTQAASEILSANVQFTELGMKIFDNVHDTETQVTYNEFSTRRRSDGEVLFEADDSGVVTNDLGVKGRVSYIRNGQEVIRQLTIPNGSNLAGLAFIRVS